MNYGKLLKGKTCGYRKILEVPCTTDAVKRRSFGTTKKLTPVQYTKETADSFRDWRRIAPSQRG
jgi:hypothetical protein